jgi:hypothetical protein
MRVVSGHQNESRGSNSTYVSLNPNGVASGSGLLDQDSDPGEKKLHFNFEQITVQIQKTSV